MSTVHKFSSNCDMNPHFTARTFTDETK